MAEGKAKVRASDGLNVRAGAGTNYSKIGALTNGTSVTYYGEQNGWLQIKHNGRTGYISKQYTSITQAATSGGGGSSSSGGGLSTLYVNTGVLNVRNGPGTGNSKIGSVSMGTKLTVVGEQNGWARIKYGSGYGWVSKQYTSAKAPSSGSGDGSSSGGIKNDARFAKVSYNVAMSMGGYRSKGLCATGVSRAISKHYGLWVGGNGNQIDNNLPRSHFKQLNISLGQALKYSGLILTWERTSTKLGSIYGHTAITQGNGQSSSCDFYENNTLGAKGRSGFKCFVHK